MYSPNDPSPAPESNKRWDPQNVSHMLHAIVGLDRYPNYLSRFQDVNDVIALENALRQSLDKVEQQKNDMVKRRKSVNHLVRHYSKLKKERNDQRTEAATDDTDDIAAGVWSSDLCPPKSWAELKQRNILNEEAFNVAFQSMMKTNIHRPCELDAVLNGKVNLDLSPFLLEDLMDEEMFDVYSFPLLSVEVGLNV